MTGLPRTCLVQTPLLFLAVSLAAGILLGRYAPSSRSILIGGVVIAAGLMLIAIWHGLRRKFRRAAAVLLIAFFGTGVVLSLIENQPADPNRIKQMFDD